MRQSFPADGLHAIINKANKNSRNVHSILFSLLQVPHSVAITNVHVTVVNLSPISLTFVLIICLNKILSCTHKIKQKQQCP